MKKLTTLLILFISLAFVAPMQVSAISIPPEPGPTSLSCEPSPLEIYHGDSAYFTVTIMDNDSDDQIKIQSPKVRVSNTGEIKNKSRFTAKERESDNPESGDRTFEVSFTGGPVHDLNGTTEDTVTFEAIYQEASTKEGSLFVRDIKQSASCLLVVTHSKKPTPTPSGGGFHPPEESGNKSGQLREGAGVKPGSFFYFFDTAFENIGLFFTFNPEKKAQKALEHADERLAEIEAIAEENNPNAIKTAIASYENNIALATEKSKEVKDKGKAETLLTSIEDNTSRNQEVLSAVLIKVPEEAKEAITRAIEASKKGQEEATKQIAELKSKIEQLKKEVVELKAKDEERGKVIEELGKQKTTSIPKPVTTPSQTQTQTTEPAPTPAAKPALKNITETITPATTQIKNFLLQHLPSLRVYAEVLLDRSNSYGMVTMSCAEFFTLDGKTTLSYIPEYVGLKQFLIENNIEAKCYAVNTGISITKIPSNFADSYAISANGVCVDYTGGYMGYNSSGEATIAQFNYSGKVITHAVCKKIQQ